MSSRNGVTSPGPRTRWPSSDITVRRCSCRAISRSMARLAATGSKPTTSASV
ncbi:hypothetical protein ACFQ60_37680 [Streptomyces zhihengii]